MKLKNMFDLYNFEKISFFFNTIRNHLPRLPLLPAFGFTSVVSSSPFTIKSSNITSSGIDAITSLANALSTLSKNSNQVTFNIRIINTIYIILTHNL